MRIVKFGIIGPGLMGREFASAAARWFHLPDMDIKPEIISICGRSRKNFPWYLDNIPSISQAVTDYRELLSNEEVEAVYCAVPHDLHEEIYCAIIKSGKHLMAEKPFGIDKEANNTILRCMEAHPDVFVRCSSQFHFFPGVQKIGQMIDNEEFGKIIEVNSGFLHSSDLDPDKPINWKRMIDINGEYGCMGDLGMHACHIPFKAGWKIHNVRAILSNIITSRPDGKGNTVPCETWDNATLFCETSDRTEESHFPLTIKTQRIAPGEKNSWYIEILGTKTSVHFSTKDPKRLSVLEYSGKEQAWQQIDMGHETAYKSITGGIFEFGFSDSILQMWAAFLNELQSGKPQERFTGCVTPEETALSHKLFTAALQSNAQKYVVELT